MVGEHKIMWVFGELKTHGVQHGDKVGILEYKWGKIIYKFNKDAIGLI